MGVIRTGIKYYRERQFAYGYYRDDRDSQVIRYYCESRGKRHGISPLLVYRLIHGKTPENELERMLVDNWKKIDCFTPFYQSMRSAEEKSKEFMQFAELLESRIDETSQHELSILVSLLFGNLEADILPAARSRLVDVIKNAVGKLQFDQTPM